MEAKSNVQHDFQRANASQYVQYVLDHCHVETVSAQKRYIFSLLINRQNIILYM